MHDVSRNCGTWAKMKYLHYNTQTTGVLGGDTAIQEEASDIARMICKGMRSLNMWLREPLGMRYLCTKCNNAEKQQADIACMFVVQIFSIREFSIRDIPKPPNESSKFSNFLSLSAVWISVCLRLSSGFVYPSCHGQGSSRATLSFVCYLRLLHQCFIKRPLLECILQRITICV